MCGIAGVFDFNARNNERGSQLRSAIRTIAHRGPDEEGFFESPQASLGMCRLSIIDVKGGHQPNFNADKSVVSVFNGEIYNFGELQKILAQRGHKLTSYGDSECIPYLYQEFGLDFPKYLQGMFAIAIWDEKLGRSILVRDRFGKKPLWYSNSRDQLCFASEVKGLFELGISREVNLSAIPEYLQYGYVNAPRSAFQNISQLNPGSIMTFDGKKISEKPYWDIGEIQLQKLSYGEAKERVHFLLRESVRDRVISERPIGSFLSGGIDSTLISSLMAKEVGENLHTFTIGFDDKQFDESRYAAPIAGHLRTHHHNKIISPEPALVLETLGRVLDQPFADSSIIPTYLLSKFARENVVVALGGDGGDEVFGGYTRYSAGIYLDRINFLLAINPSRYISKYVTKYPRLEKLMRHSQFQSLQRRYSGFQSLVQKTELRDVLVRELHSLLSDPHESIWNLVETKDRLSTMQKIDLRTYLPGDLMFKADMASMANSLELRSPMLDYRVVELGLSLPSNYKIVGSTTKRILRDILDDYVPRNLVERPKMGFGIPRAKWLRHELRPLLEDLLFDSRSRERNWLNSSELRRIVNDHYKGRDLDRVIWPSMMLELWARNWIDS